MHSELRMATSFATLWTSYLIHLHTSGTTRSKAANQR